MPFPLLSRARLLPGSPTIMLCSAILGLCSGCSLFGIESVEEASYRVVSAEKQFELRDYAALVVAETRVTGSYKEAGNKAFGILFAYISGDNEGEIKVAMTAPVIASAESGDAGENIAMTAPVISRQDGDGWRYGFVLPQLYSLETAPRPLNPEVSLTEIPAKRVASLRYSGRSTAKTRAEQIEALYVWLNAQELISQSEPRWAGYNPPWTLPWFRRNEVLIDVASQ